MPLWAIVVMAAEAVVILALGAAVALLWRLTNGVLYAVATRLDALGRRLDDVEAVLTALRDDARAFDERIAAVEDDVETIKENPLGPPVDAEEGEDENA